MTSNPGSISIYPSNVLHQPLPLFTLISQSRPSIAMPIKLAMQIPPESLTLVAPRENSRSSEGTLSIIEAKVLT